MPNEKHEFAWRTERIEELVARIDAAGDPAIRSTAQELLRAVIDLHGIALDRILEAIAKRLDADALLTELAGDALVSGVLSLHDLHPVSLAQRVSEALESTRPFLRSHGGDVELQSIENGIVRIALHGACKSCSGSADTMKQRVEEAIVSVAPEVAEIVCESLPAQSHSDLVILKAG